jgi:hypothetical protein
MENHFSRYFKLTVCVIAFILSLSLSLGTGHGQDFNRKGGLKAWLAERGIDHDQFRQRFREAMQVQNRNQDMLMELSGVVGTGTGITAEGEVVVKVFTARAGIRGIPASLDGVAVRTKVTGKFYALRDNTNTCNFSGDGRDGVCEGWERWPLPVPIGVSVGHPAITAGTLGARVTDGADVFILSNNHVLANGNQANLGDPILQPGSFDGGVDPDDAVAYLSDYQEIKWCEYWWIFLICNQTNTIDAAIARSTTGDIGFETPMGEYGSVPGYGAPKSTIHAAYGDPVIIGDENLNLLLGQSVQKYGRTTSNTVGTVDSINVTVDVCYDDLCDKVARFVNQLIITPGTFSAGGDSGSVIVTKDADPAENAKPVGLLFAGSDVDTVANRIDLVLNAFGVDIDGEGALPSLSIDDVTVTEGEGGPTTAAIFTATLSASSSENVTVEFATSDDSATAGEDYVTNSGTLTFPAGITTRTITIEVNDDSSEEPNEYFHVNLSNPTNATIADDRGVGTILDDDAPPPTPQITMDDVSVDEGGSGTTATADFTVILSAATTNTVTVDYTTNSGPGTSANPGEDYEDVTGTLTFSPGMTSKTISVTVYGDDIEEPDENFFVDLINPVNANIVDNRGEGIIVNDDTPFSSGPQLETGKVWATTAGWTTVELGHDYGNDMVVICTPNYEYDAWLLPEPLVAHVQNANGSSFQVKLVQAVGGSLQDVSADVYYMVVKAGVYTLAEHGVKMEAVKFNSTITDGSGSWVGENRSYSNSYTNPVVVGQVMTYNADRAWYWSVFWSRGSSRTSPPSSTTLFVGKHNAQDPRAVNNEMIGYVVVEAGEGTMDTASGEARYFAALGPDTVRGVYNAAPYTYTLKDGGDGGWAVLYGSNPVTSSSLKLAIEEDMAWDSERKHTSEQVGYIVFE